MENLFFGRPLINLQVEEGAATECRPYKKSRRGSLPDGLFAFALNV